MLRPVEQQFEATVQTSVTGLIQQRMLNVAAAIPDADHGDDRHPAHHYLIR